jgi:hypothetical protein
MARGFKVDALGLDTLLEEFQEYITIEMPQLVRKHARLLCVELANRTQPFSVGAKAKKAKDQGERAARRGVTTVIPKQDFYESIIDRTKSESLRARLRELVVGKRWEEFAKVMVKLGMWTDARVISQSQMKAQHNKQRSKKSGRAFALNRKANLPGGNVDAYIRKVIRKVGLSKSGWADCARQIGGIKGDGARGIPAFGKAKRHGKHGRIKDNTKNVKDPHIMVENTLPWVSRICDEQAQLYALSITRGKMFKEAEMIAKGIAKRSL